MKSKCVLVLWALCLIKQDILVCTIHCVNLTHIKVQLTSPTPLTFACVTVNPFLNQRSTGCVKRLFIVLEVKGINHKVLVDLELIYCIILYNTRPADKSLARPGRKQARKHVRDARDCNKTRDASCRQVLFPARQGAEENAHHSDRNISLFPSWSG